MSKFEKFWKKLTPEEKDQYSVSVDTSVDYISKHYFHSNPKKRKNPRPNRRERMAKASRGKLTELDIVKHFMEPA